MIDVYSTMLLMQVMVKIPKVIRGMEMLFVAYGTCTMLALTLKCLAAEIDCRVSVQCILCAIRTIYFRYLLS